MALRKITNTSATNVEDWIEKFNQMDSDVGNLDFLNTTTKSSLVLALNEINTTLSDELDSDISATGDRLDSIDSSIGNLPSLATDNKTSIVAAINEVHGEVDSNASLINTRVTKSYIDGLGIRAANADDADNLDGQPGAYYLDYNNFTNRPTIGNGGITINAGNGLNGGGWFSTNQTFGETITINHNNTSNAPSVNNSGNTVIQDIYLDGYGHVTGINSTSINTTSQSLGVGQRWQFVSRSTRTWYQNTTGKPIEVMFRSRTGGVTFVRVGPNTGWFASMAFADGSSGTWTYGTFIVPPNHYYYLDPVGTTLFEVHELR